MLPALPVLPWPCKTGCVSLAPWPRVGLSQPSVSPQSALIRQSKPQGVTSLFAARPRRRGVPQEGARRAVGPALSRPLPRFASCQARCSPRRSTARSRRWAWICCCRSSTCTPRCWSCSPSRGPTTSPSWMSSRCAGALGRDRLFAAIRAPGGELQSGQCPAPVRADLPGPHLNAALIDQG